jgi:hypothetical protein
LGGRVEVVAAVVAKHLPAVGQPVAHGPGADHGAVSVHRLDRALGFEDGDGLTDRPDGDALLFGEVTSFGSTEPSGYSMADRSRFARSR